MSTRLADRYQHFDITGETDRWKTVQPSSFGVAIFKLLAYERFLGDEYQIAPGEPVEITPEEQVLIADASDFVEQITGIPVTSPLQKYTELRNGMVGAYDVSLHRVAVYKQSVGSEFGDTISFGSLLVHELTHSTSVDTAKVLDIQNGEGHCIYTLFPHHITEVTPSFHSDHFFEEGLAEEIASRWRVQFDHNLHDRDRDLLATRERAAVPVRMYSPPVTIDETKHDNERGIRYPAYCSFGIQLLSEYTGVDLIDLLIQARKPETQLEAANKIKRTVNSVEPGLYEILTSAEYTVDDFQDCLEIIKQAIANHAHDQHALSA